MQTDLSEMYSIQKLQWLINIALGRVPEYKLTPTFSSFHIDLIRNIGTFLNELAKRTENQAIDDIFNETGVLYQLLYRNLNHYSPLMNIFDALYFKGIIDVRTAGNEDIFPVSNALIHAFEPGQPIPGDTEGMAKLELGFISQCIYHAFRVNFGNGNLWHEFNNLPLGNIVQHFPTFSLLNER